MSCPALATPWCSRILYPVFWVPAVVPMAAGTSQVAYLSPHVLHVGHRGPPPFCTEPLTSEPSCCCLSAQANMTVLAVLVYLKCLRVDGESIFSKRNDRGLEQIECIS